MVVFVNHLMICQQSLRSTVWRSPMCVVCLHKKLIASMVECVLTWIREQYLVVCSTAKNILCIVVHFQPVIKLFQKGVGVHHRRVILMQKMQNKISGEGHPTPHPLASRLAPSALDLGASILTPSILKFCLCYWVVILSIADINVWHVTLI